MLKGIVVVASGSPYYGRMAYNLALSIRAAKEPCPVAVLYNGAAINGLAKEQLELFAECVKMPDSLTPIECKLSMYKYSPFEETVYIDADNIWLPQNNPADLFRQFKKEVLFSGITEGFYNPLSLKYDESNYIFWASPEEICDKWLIHNVLYQWRSEVLYFKKSFLAEQLFEIALKVFCEPRVKYDEFANTVPDELCINIAAAKLGSAPHKYKWSPSFWPAIEGRFTDVNKISKAYWILSTGGNSAPAYLQEMYNNILRYCGHYTRREFYKLKPKTAFMNERFKY